MEPKQVSEAEQKERIRSALDILQNYVGDDGKLNGTKLCEHITKLKARVAELEGKLIDEEQLRAARTRQFQEAMDLKEKAEAQLERVREENERLKRGYSNAKG